MEKGLNKIGYISLLAIPYLYIVFEFEFHDLVRNLSLIVLLIIIIFQVIHYMKTKVKYWGIRIFITIITISIVSFIIYSGYGIIKNKQAKDIANTIEKISFEGHEISKEEIENNMKFVNSKGILSKWSSDAIIYYIDGTTEETTICGYPEGWHVIQIKDDKYSIMEEEINTKVMQN